MKKSITLLSMAALLAACAETGPVSTTVEHKGKTTIVHHRHRTTNGAVDHIEAIAANGTVSEAEVHVYDLGRYVDASGNVHEGHKLYRTVQSERPSLMLPKRVSGGPRSGPFAPANYTPMPNDQRINDAVTEAKQAKEKLDSARSKIDQQLAQDNNLRGEIQDQSQQIADLQSQLNAAMSTQRNQKPAPQTDAEKAAQSATSDLQRWGQTVGQQ
jgi:hypothetical protein